ncbi:hypothetical protein [Paenibacillus turpanensis]|uniref:hypothetical protein n=1 Tax=Paenibacillus turpanensis TaxID=2689078 RepID=UPI00140D137D|nr:hypothetical protein [Paenibacillus turpanensis]
MKKRNAWIKVLLAASMASTVLPAAALAAPRGGIYVGGDVDKFYSIDAFLSDHNFNQALDEMLAAPESALYVDSDGYAAHIHDLLTAETVNDVLNFADEADFDAIGAWDGFQSISVDGEEGERYTPAADLEPAAGPTEVLLAEGSVGKAVHEAILNLIQGKRYLVTVDSRTYGVKSNGMFGAEGSAPEPLAETAIRGLTNGTLYMVKEDPSAVVPSGEHSGLSSVVPGVQGSREVTLALTVKNKYGEVLTGLKAEQFQIRINGAEPVSFANEQFGPFAEVGSGQYSVKLKGTADSAVYELTNLTAADVLIHENETVTMPAADPVPADASSAVTGVTYGASGSKQVVIQLTVKNSNNAAVTGLQGSDIWVQVNEAEPTSLTGGGFSSFAQLGEGMYSVTFTGDADNALYEMTNWTAKGVRFHDSVTVKLPGPAAQVPAPVNSRILEVVQGDRGSKQVKVTMEVRDEKGAIITGLTASDFTVQVEHAAPVSLNEGAFSGFAEIEPGYYSVTFTGSEHAAAYTLSNLSVKHVVISETQSVMTPSAERELFSDAVWQDGYVFAAGSTVTIQPSLLLHATPDESVVTVDLGGVFSAERLVDTYDIVPLNGGEHGAIPLHESHITNSGQQVQLVLPSAEESVITFVFNDKVVPITPGTYTFTFTVNGASIEVPVTVVGVQ